MAKSKTVGRSMGIGTLGADNTCFKRKYRWLFEIPDVADEGINALPAFKSSRPSLQFKEIELQHMSETLYYPGKPDWKPVSLTLYDIKKGQNTIFDWIKNYYDPNGSFNYAVDFKIHQATLKLYDGCGFNIEKWIFENVWCQNVEFGELDYALSDVVTVDLTMRYDRAYTTATD